MKTELLRGVGIAVAAWSLSTYSAEFSDTNWNALINCEARRNAIDDLEPVYAYLNSLSLEELEHRRITAAQILRAAEYYEIENGNFVAIESRRHTLELLGTVIETLPREATRSQLVWVLNLCDAASVLSSQVVADEANRRWERGDLRFCIEYYNALAWFRQKDGSNYGDRIDWGRAFGQFDKAIHSEVSMRATSYLALWTEFVVSGPSLWSKVKLADLEAFLESSESEKTGMALSVRSVVEFLRGELTYEFEPVESKRFLGDRYFSWYVRAMMNAEYRERTLSKDKWRESVSYLAEILGMGDVNAWLGKE